MPTPSRRTRVHRPLGVLVAALATTVAVAACGEDRATESPIATVPGSTPDPTAAPPTSAPPTSAPQTAPPSSEPTAETLRQELAAARERWAAAGIVSYTWRYRPTCFCPPEEVAVTVLGGHRVGGGERPLGVDEWFDLIDEELATAARVQLEFDDATGRPLSVYIDRDEQIADEEYGLVDVVLEPLADPLATVLADDYGCGYGFTAADPEQTIAMVVSFGVGFGAEPPAAGSYGVADLERAQLRFGSDLMANWCDDVIEPGEPEATVADEWTLVGGTLTVSVDGPVAVGRFEDLVARGPDGDVDLGGTAIRNEAWGTFAG